MHQSTRGVTLIELMVVVALVAIIASIAVPSYRNYILRTQRTDATAALLRVTAAQEKFYLQNNTYAADSLVDDPPPTGLGISGTEHGWYTITVAARNGSFVNGFTATATVPSGSPQANDTACTSFSIDDTGQKTALK